MSNPTKYIFTTFKSINESKQHLRKIISEDDELKERSSDLRNVSISKLGWKEKGSELSSGGELNSEFTAILNKLFTEYNQTQSNCKGIFTSGNDKYHQNIKSYKSLHASGLAVDVTLPSGCHASFIQILRKYMGEYPGFSYKNEYTNPSAKSTGGHFHLSYRRGQPETESTYKSDFENQGQTNSGEVSKDTSSTSSGFKDPAGALIGGQLMKQLGFGESTNKKITLSEGLSLGSKVNYSGSYAIIPSDSNSKVKSPIDGKVDNLKYISGCNNQILIKSSSSDNYLLYCGITRLSVSDGDKVSVGDTLGSISNDVKVTLYNNRFEPIKISKDTELKKKTKSDDEDLRKGYQDPILGVLTSPVKSFKQFFRIKDKDKKDDSLFENIKRIKSLIK